MDLDPTANGSPGLHGDEAIIAALEESSAAVRARAEELRAELAKVAPELRRYDKAIAALRGEPAGHPQTAAATPRKREKKGLTGAAMDRVRAEVLKLAEATDDFTQVDVRSVTGDSSGVTSIAFETLRQEGMIRLVRRDGNLKIYRLTAEALASREA